MTIPKIIWSIWYQGMDQAPVWANQCWATFRKYNPEWDLRILTDETLSQWIPQHGQYTQIVHSRKNGWNKRDEIYRLLLLQKYGGVWADASLVCTRPFNTWLNDASPNGFFVFKSGGVKGFYII